MWTIWKYKIPLCESFKIEMPKTFNIIHVREIDNEPYLWAIVDNESELIKVKFVIVYTGREVHKDLFYVDTCIIYGVVLHIFIDERYEEEEDGNHKN